MRRCQRPYDADKFVRICRLLRVLNALRLMGIPLTFTQLEELSPASIVDRLVVLGHWPMAVKLCEFLEINSKEGVYKVIAHWCLAMMTTFKEQNRFENFRKIIGLLSSLMLIKLFEFIFFSKSTV